MDKLNSRLSCDRLFKVKDKEVTDRQVRREDLGMAIALAAISAPSFRLLVTNNLELLSQHPAGVLYKHTPAVLSTQPRQPGCASSA